MPLDPHPLAAHLPDMPAAKYAEHKESIRQYGQKVPIVRFEGKILDGRHRYRACVELGIEPQCEDFTGTEEQAAVLVEVLNLDRRNLTPEEERKARIALTAELKAKGMSNREIAVVTGKSEPTVRRDLKADDQVRHRDAPDPPAPQPKEEPTDTQPEESMNGTSTLAGTGSIKDIVRLARQGMAIPDIARELDRSEVHVRRTVRQARERGELPPNPGVTGTDGKKYPARKPDTRPDRPGSAAERHDESKLGVGMTVANKVINLLRKIPRDDRSRAKGLRAVHDWINLNK